MLMQRALTDRAPAGITKESAMSDHVCKVAHLRLGAKVNLRRAAR
jgi:hypothetical protein